MTDVAPDPTTSTEDVETKSKSIQDIAVVQNDSAAKTPGAQNLETQEDLNPRSPKRRRISPVNDDTEIDFEAAAARALAISLGVNLPSESAIAVNSPSQHNGSTSMPSVQTLSSPMPSRRQVQLDNLRALDDVATEILSTLAKMSHLEIGEMLFGPPSQRARDYKALKIRFEQSKQAYMINSPFLSPVVLGFKDIDQVETIRKTNMATFMASIFSGEIGLRIMDINFLDVFVPEGGRLLKAQASIYLELKTQAFIAAKRTAPAILNQVMLDLFPEDMEKYLVAIRPGAKSLAPSELDFLKRLASRREILYADMRNKRLDNLELRYRWDDFSREVNSYLSKNYDQSGSSAKEKGDQPSPGPARAHLQQDQMESQFSLASIGPLAETSDLPDLAGGLDIDFDMDDFMAQAARAAEIALQGAGHAAYVPSRPAAPVTTQPPTTNSLPSSAVKAPQMTIVKQAPQQQTPVTTTPPSPPTAPFVPQENQDSTTPTINPEFQQYKPLSAEKPAGTGETGSDDGEGNDVPHKSQTAPTQVLYERARLVTTNKALPPSRKPNPPSHRRPWTNEEENALMTGLDQVKGPHWSLILAMYGPGGTVNESLKDRNQVQLKDKARNLKLFFLKAGIEVPYYLQAVTGDLKTRAPGQAEKREARERERTNADEDANPLQQDDAQADIGDDTDLLMSSITDQDELQETTPTAYQAGDEQIDSLPELAESAVDEDFDMEAMIARAAASATQSLDNPWP